MTAAKKTVRFITMNKKKIVVSQGAETNFMQVDIFLIRWVVGLCVPLALWIIHFG